MKLVRFGEPGRERPGLLLDLPDRPAILDVRAAAYDIEDYDGFFFSNCGIDRVAALACENDRNLIPTDMVRLGPPIARPGKIICVGKNYADHAKEFDSVIPESPVLFSKASTSLSGPFDPIMIRPENSTADAEVELGVVIGRRAREVRKEEALSYIAGCAVVNDVTDRKAQKEGLQWFRGKSFDSFCPVGPWLVTPDEFDPSQAAALSSRLNDQQLQNGSTRDMIFGVAELIAFISRDITLEPGDLIVTGTPSGVGFARTPPVFLNEGDTIECTVDGIGTICNRVVTQPA